MLKAMLLASTLIVAAPALAQEVPAPEPSTNEQPSLPPEVTPVQTEAAPAAAVPAAVPVEESNPATLAEQAELAQPATPAAEPAAVAEQPDPPTGEAVAAVAEPSPQQPATSQTEVADVVTREFATYDKDASGQLDASEFSAWMAALRKASDPGFDPAAADSAAWMSQAFAQADLDKSSTVNSVELTSFLTPKG